MRARRVGAAVVTIAVFTACHDPTAEPGPHTPVFDLNASAACPASPNHVVTNESELYAALAAAAAGDVIAVDGFFAAGDAIIGTDDVTLTCATPGSGLRGRGDLGLIIKVVARRVTVSDLVLDATSSVEGAYLAFFDGVTAFGEDIRFLRNTVACGATRKCVFFGSEVQAGARGGLVADNHVSVAGADFGIELRGVDGTRVERNTVVATTPAADGIFASGIGAAGSANVAVTDNVVTGPWTEAAVNFEGVVAGLIGRNQLEGALDDGIDLIGSEDIQVLNNTVQCGNGCLVAAASPRALIADNHFESGGSFTGVHLQGGTDGDRIERNMIIATAPSGAPAFGAIRVRDGSDVLVGDDTVLGPWSNGVAATELTRSRFERNQLQGAAGYGIHLSTHVAGTPPPALMTNNLFRNNRVTGAGSAGVLAQLACANQFVGNNLQGNAGNVGAIFDESTGANILVGNQHVVIDNALPLDCNGDGVGDPNIITGPGRVLHGVAFGQPPGVAALKGGASSLR